MIVNRGGVTMFVMEKDSLDKPHNRGDRAGDAGASAATMFEKALRAFEMGDLAFSDLQSSLTRLLDEHAHPDELLKVLQRLDFIEPLPQEARDKIIAVLKEAKPVGIAEHSMASEQLPVPAISESSRVSVADEDSDSSAMLRLIQDLAVTWDKEPKGRSAPTTRAPAKSLQESGVQNADTDYKQSADYKALRFALGQREDDLAALQSEHSRVLGLLEARARSAAQLQQEMRDTTGQLEAARSALQTEQSKTRDGEKVLAERTAAEEAARTRSDKERRDDAARQAETQRKEVSSLRKEVSSLREKLAARDANIETMRATLSERDAAIEQLKQAQAARDGVITQARELLAERDAQIAALRSEHANELDRALGAQQQQHSKAATALAARLKDAEAELHAARAKQQQSAHVEEEPDLEQTMPLSPVAESPRSGLDLRRGLEIGDFSVPPVPPSAPSFLAGAMGRSIAICAALVVLGIILWVATRHAPPAAEAPVLTAVAPPPAPGNLIHDCPSCPSFTVLPAGKFKQGSADNNASPTVRPVHWVTIDRPFAMSINTVTVDQFRAFATATGRDMQGCDIYDGKWKHQPKSSWENPGFDQTGSHPVTCASWSDAQAYAHWLSEQTGQRYRLPSASEWEYAARAGGEAAQPWSSNGADACSNANVADLSAARHFPGWVAFSCNDGFVFTAPVGSFKSNAFGLSDMLGNVFQWTDDCWNASYKAAPVDGSARTDGNCTEHELRGGSWFSSPGYVRADYRNHFAANYRASSTGIRLVRDVTP